MSSLNDHFDKIYVPFINDKELLNIKNKLNKRSINPYYYPAVVGNEKAREFSQLERCNIKTLGAFGHVNTFIGILSDAIDKNYNKILILEPDIYFAKDFDRLVETYLKLDYDVLYFGASQYKWLCIDQDNDIRERGYYKANNTCGTFAIGLDRNVFQEYLNILKKFEYPSDICLFDIHKKYNCLVAYPNIIICDVSNSSTSESRNQISTSRKFRWVRNYDIRDNYSFLIKQGAFYEIFINLNSFTKELMGTIYLRQHGNPLIQFKLPDKCLSDGQSMIRHSILIYSEGSVIDIETSDLHVDKITLSELTRNTFVLKMKKQLSRVTSNPTIKVYSKTILEKTNSLPPEPPKIRNTVNKEDRIKKSQPRVIVLN